MTQTSCTFETHLCSALSPGTGLWGGIHKNIKPKSLWTNPVMSDLGNERQNKIFFTGVAKTYEVVKLHK